MRKIIFDLDLTLVDTSSLEDARRRRAWQEVYENIPKTRLYDGIEEVLRKIQEHAIPVVIVSTAPATYVEKVLAYYRIQVTSVVGYHDAKPIKPHPASMLKALDLLSAAPDQAISFGDRAIDIAASNAAGIESVACFWGTKERADLLRSGYRHAIIEPREILTLIR